MYREVFQKNLQEWMSKILEVGQFAIKAIQYDF